MKNYIVPIILSLIVGFISAKFMFNQYEYETNMQTVFKKQTKVYLIQLGVYSSLDTMKESLKNFKYYTYEFKDDKYYTYIGITKEEENLEKLKGYYKDLGYVIYVKEQNISNKTFLETLSQYDALLKNTDEEDVIGAIMAQILAEYEKRS